jgi:hypothetical protein
LGLAGLTVAVGCAIVDAVLAEPRMLANPGVADTVLASRAVVAAVRIAVIAAAGYVVLSVVMLARRGQFLTRVGPVEVSEQFASLMAENAELKAAADRAMALVAIYEAGADEAGDSVR